MGHARPGLLAAVALSVMGGCDHWSPPEHTIEFCQGRPDWYVDTTFRFVRLVARRDELFLHLADDGDASDLVLGDRDIPGVNAPFLNVVAAISAESGTVKWIREMEFQGSAGQLAITPDGRLFSAEAAEGGTGMLSELDADGGEVIRSSPAVVDSPKAMAASDDIVVVAGDGTVSAHDARTGERLWQNETIGGAKSLAITSDGNVAVAQTLEGSRIHLSLLNGDNGALLWDHGPRSLGQNVAALPGGDIALLYRDGNGGSLIVMRFGGDGTVKWTRTIDGTSGVLDMAVLADGDLALAGTGPYFDGQQVPEQCRYVARITPSDGFTRDVRSFCYCGDTSSAALNDEGRTFVVIDSTRGANPIAPFDPGDPMAHSP
jgi:outer membrane protein assembly factor BamB